MGRWTLLACLLGLFILWCALVASRDSFSVSEEELLEVVQSLITLSWLELLGKRMAFLFLEWLGLVGSDLTRDCLVVGLLASFLVGLG